jgi:hypothetical protein
MTDYAVPPRELMEQWASEKCYDERDWLYEFHIANRAAQWGADQELEACLRLVEIDGGEDAYDFARYIRAARRPKPPSLKEQALEAAIRLGKKYPSYEGADIETIRRALEALPE